MSEPRDAGPTDELLRRTLGHEAVWAQPPSSLEDDVVDAIDRLAGRSPTRRGVASWRTLALASAAAAVVAIVVAVVAVTVEPPRRFDTVHELTATALAPTADARVEVTVTAVGTRLVLDVRGLGPAGPDEVYEAWMLDGDRAVSAGTFHLRGRDTAAIELWSGVPPGDFDELVVTRHPIGSRPPPGGVDRTRVVLEGSLAP